MLMKVTLLGWMNYDNTLFDTIVTPNGITKQQMIDSILLRCGEFNVIYSNLDFLKFAIKNWSERHLYQFNKIIEAIEASYNPVHNYDRYEDISDQHTGTSSDDGSNGFTQTGSGKTTVEGADDYTDTTDATTENLISADNASTYQPDNKTEVDSELTHEETYDSETNTSSSIINKASSAMTHKENDSNDHTAHMYGNIGVTTSQKMVEDEIVLREKFGIYDIIAASFAEEFCVMIY